MRMGKSRLFLKEVKPLASVEEVIARDDDDEATFGTVKWWNFNCFLERVKIANVRDKIVQVCVGKAVMPFLEIIENLS